MFDIVYQRPGDGPVIERLLDHCFEPERRRRPTYRLRDGFAPADGLSFIALHNSRLVGTLRFWPVTISDTIDGVTPALLLGPLAIDPDVRGHGGATRLVRRGLDEVRRFGHRIVVAVGDPEFFARFGFSSARQAGLAMPLLVEDARLVVHETVAGALTGVTGVIGPVTEDEIGPVALRATASR